MVSYSNAEDVELEEKEVKLYWMERVKKAERKRKEGGKKEGKK